MNVIFLEIYINKGIDKKSKFINININIDNIIEKAIPFEKKSF